MTRLTIEDRMFNYAVDGARKIYGVLKSKFYHEDDAMIKKLVDIIEEGIIDNGEYAMNFAREHLIDLEIYALKEDTDKFEAAYFARD